MSYAKPIELNKIEISSKTSRKHMRPESFQLGLGAKVILLDFAIQIKRKDDDYQPSFFRNLCFRSNYYVDIEWRSFLFLFLSFWLKGSMKTEFTTDSLG